MRDIKARLERVSFRALEKLEDMIAVMQAAAEQVSLGSAPEKISPGCYRLYAATTADGQAAVISVLTLEEYFHLLSSAAEEMGLHLHETAELVVRLPEAEFGDNMVTGGFEEFRGVGVELRSNHLEELVDLVCIRLKHRGLIVSCAADDVIFCLPLFRGLE
jgi:hypothetical protein